MQTKAIATVLILSIVLVIMMAQQTSTTEMTDTAALPYRSIPEAPSDYSNVNVVARMIDGLGYRYYWATEGLRPEDLTYRPSPDARTAAETLNHLYGLSSTILMAPKQEPNIRPLALEDLSFEELRRKTLENFAAASSLLKSSKPKQLKNFKIIFKRGKSQSEFPFWNMLNGPIADAIYHTGQIVSFRRASGNPMDAGVNVFMGKTKGE